MLAATLPDPLAARVMRADVVVVGAGPAGALAARETARAGARTILVERSRFPRPKVCGGCLGAGAVEVLRSVGLGDVPRVLAAPPLHTFAVSTGGRTVRLRLTGGYAVSRLDFDHALVEAARSEGVEWWPETRARLGEPCDAYRTVELEGRDGRAAVRAGVVLDATGLGSSLDPAMRDRVRRGSRIGLGVTLDDDTCQVGAGEVRMVVGADGYVGLVRPRPGVLTVAAALDPSRLRGSPPAAAVAAILASAGVRAPERLLGSPVKGTPLLTRAPTAVSGPRLLRLGDAAGYVEPFTGEGMCWAMTAAVAVAALAVEGADRWRPELADRWTRRHREAFMRGARLCAILTPLLRRPALVSGALAALDLAPSLASPLVRLASRPPRSASVGTTWA